MKTNYWEIETPDGVLQIANGLPSEIRMNNELVSEMRKWWPPEIHEFDFNGVPYKVKISMSIKNPFRNVLGIKCSVERDGELIADDPDHVRVDRRFLVSGIVFIIVLGLIFGAILIYIDPLG